MKILIIILVTLLTAIAIYFGGYITSNMLNKAPDITSKLDFHDMKVEQKLEHLDNKLDKILNILDPKLK